MLEFHRKCILQYALVLCSLFVLRVVITEERLWRGAFFRKICGTTAFQLVKTQPFCRHCLKILICRACTLAISLDPKYLFVIHQKWTSKDFLQKRMSCGKLLSRKNFSISVVKTPEQGNVEDTFLAELWNYSHLFCWKLTTIDVVM